MLNYTNITQILLISINILLILIKYSSNCLNIAQNIYHLYISGTLTTIARGMYFATFGKTCHLQKVGHFFMKKKNNKKKKKKLYLEKK